MKCVRTQRGTSRRCPGARDPPSRGATSEHLRGVPVLHPIRRIPLDALAVERRIAAGDAPVNLPARCDAYGLQEWMTWFAVDPPRRARAPPAGPRGGTPGGACGRGSGHAGVAFAQDQPRSSTIISTIPLPHQPNFCTNLIASRT
jgi:hypothetical protein